MWRQKIPAWWPTSVIPALRRLKQENLKVKATKINKNKKIQIRLPTPTHLMGSVSLENLD